MLAGPHSGRRRRRPPTDHSCAEPKIRSPPSRHAIPTGPTPHRRAQHSCPHSIYNIHYELVSHSFTSWTRIPAPSLGGAYLYRRTSSCFRRLRVSPPRTVFPIPSLHPPPPRPTRSTPDTLRCILRGRRQARPAFIHGHTRTSSGRLIPALPYLPVACRRCADILSWACCCRWNFFLEYIIFTNSMLACSPQRSSSLLGPLYLRSALSACHGAH